MRGRSSALTALRRNNTLVPRARADAAGADPAVARSGSASRRRRSSRAAARHTARSSSRCRRSRRARSSCAPRRATSSRRCARRTCAAAGARCSSSASSSWPGWSRTATSSSRRATADADGRLLRPDLVVKLPGGKNVVVDAKAPLNAYLDALECRGRRDAHARTSQTHARQVRDHITKLGREGATGSSSSPRPSSSSCSFRDETFFRAALEHDPSLLEAGVESRRASRRRRRR